MDLQAQEYLKQKNWIQAIDIFNKLLGNQQNTLDQVISYLSDRAECFMELNNYQAAIDPNSYNVNLARKRLIHSLYLLKRYAEADIAARDWLILLQELDINKEVKPILEGLLGTFINCTNSKQKTVYLLKILDTNFCINYSSSIKLALLGWGQKYLELYLAVTT
ncbi:hypothetical protein NQ317_018077 [Molorchus minor]|uniref:Uncharacterized protein n=1 Tax=Molorchus minor TaxID=1323400 RepID=A0ABQ9JG76_9CUCU|nr:hypothetical protein NQ317_018077 [Molorchus minor]